MDEQELKSFSSGRNGEFRRAHETTRRAKGLLTAIRRQILSSTTPSRRTKSGSSEEKLALKDRMYRLMSDYAGRAGGPRWPDQVPEAPHRARRSETPRGKEILRGLRLPEVPPRLVRALRSGRPRASTASSSQFKTQAKVVTP